ncbi:hypothetical protein [Cetobacterium somerae]
MKKLLLVSLFILGATSFAAVSGTANKAEMIIKVKGNVIAKTETNLIIEPVKNAGIDGSSMAFDFGSLVEGTSQSLEGTFKVYKANSDVLNADMTKVSVGILSANGTDTTPTAETANVGKSNVKVKYVVSTVASSDKKVINGVLDVNVTAPTGATAGTFLDTTKKLAVIIK